MRIHRIKLRDFRGVESAEVDFEVDGVTIVEGPNETGKTSLADAFDMLLTQKDSSAKRQIKAAQPIGRDVGPSVEAELTLGPYRVVYRKQWLRGKKTELQIYEPTAEQLVGEDAHNRMSGILEAETDQSLFAALRYQQGSEISQAPIADAPSLVAALDAAAGGGEHDPADAGRTDDLLGLVNKVRLQYFTPSGKDVAARLVKRSRIGALQAEVEATEAAIAGLDQADERLVQIAREFLDLEGQLPGLDERIAARAEELAAVESVERKVAEAKQRLELAQAFLRDVEAKQEGRGSLMVAAERAAKAFSDAVSCITAGESDLDDAVERAEASRQVQTAANEAVVDAVDAEKADREGLELLELSYLRDDLRERRDRFEEAGKEIAEAERFLAGTPIDAELVAELDRLETQVAVAVGRAEAGQARLMIEALKPLDLQVDADRRRLRPSELLDSGVAARMVAVIDDIARVVVTPAQESATAEDEVGRLRTDLRDSLQAVGVDSAAAAHELLHERSRREGDRGNARRRQGDALKDLDLAELTAKLERAEQRLEERAGGDVPLAATQAAFEEARERLHLANERVGAARAQEEEAAQDVLAAEAAWRVLEDRRIEDRTRRESAEEESQRARSALDAARATVGDEELERAAGEAKTGVDAAETTWDQAQAELEASDPKTVRVTLENDRELKRRLGEDLGRLRVEDATVRERLRLGGLEGLSDRRAEALAELTGLDREATTEDRLAEAARYLHELLLEKREQAKRAYVGPFADKVNSYARIIFGPDVKVAIDSSDFSLVARTLWGTTVPFDSLSGGAREQLAVLARLACAALVSPAEDPDARRGVPVIIDDALGYSDPARLAKLGAVFSAAGKDCQVIVLTCEPGRYRGIGGATVVALERESAAPEELVEISG